MTKPKDFSKDLADVSEAVNSDVDAIIKLVRAKDDGRGEANPAGDQPDSKAIRSTLEEPLPTSASTYISPKPLKRKASRTRTKNGPSLPQQVILENVTTRLRRGTNELLTEVALRQKLKKVEPATRQDIIEAALQDWFRRHGYSK